MTATEDERWVDEPGPDDDEEAATLGLAPSRDLWKMDVALPLAESTDLPTRPFEVGRDEDAWLAVNNRAFAWHREQSGWTRADLEQRFAEPWFDPAGFLLHEEDGRLLGFCWTKLHAHLDPTEGEVYVIAAAPEAQGRGLGRRLTVAGYDHLHRERDTPVGTLWVDADNVAAVALYERLGMRRVRTRRLYLPVD